MIRYLTLIMICSPFLDNFGTANVELFSSVNTTPLHKTYGLSNTDHTPGLRARDRYPSLAMLNPDRPLSVSFLRLAYSSLVTLPPLKSVTRKIPGF